MEVSTEEVKEGLTVTDEPPPAGQGRLTEDDAGGFVKGVESMKRGRLCISRREGEAVLIGDDIEVTVVEDNRGRLRLLIEAPKDIPIVRKELTEAA